MTIIIQERVEATNQAIRHLQESGQLDKRVLAVGVEMNQKYFEYLEALETADLQVSNGVRVAINGQVVQFKNMDDFAEWAAEHVNE